MVFGLKEEDDNFSKVDEDMIMVIADTIISERMEVLENEITKQFDVKVKILMDEQYHNKKKMKALEETIVKQKMKLQNYTIWKKR